MFKRTYVKICLDYVKICLYFRVRGRHGLSMNICGSALDRCTIFLRLKGFCPGPDKGFVGPRHYSFVGPKLGARGTNEGAEGTRAPR